MKNYSSARANKGMTTYRTPSLFRANKAIAVADQKARIKNINLLNKYGKQK